MPHEEWVGSDPFVYDMLRDQPHGFFEELPVVGGVFQFAREADEALISTLPQDVIDMGDLPWWQRAAESLDFIMGPLWDYDPDVAFRDQGEPLGGALSEVAGAGAAALGTAVAGPGVGLIAGLAVESAVEGYFHTDYGTGDTGGTNIMEMAQLPPGNTFVYVRTNPQTGLQYGKLLDGRMVYQKKDGGVTVHRPKKPIVMYPGKMDLATASRAARALGTVIKRMKKSPLRKLM